MSKSTIALLALVGLLVSLPAGAQSLISRYVAGDDYKVADTPAPRAKRDHGKVRVTEFFLYSCPHCYHFEPELNAWRKQHPDVAFSRVPVLFGPGSQPYARLYYTEVALGVVDRLHDQIFDAIHQNGRPLTSEGQMRRFMVAHGVDGRRFDKVYNSQAVEDDVQGIIARMRRYPVTAVPSISVAGRYWTSGQVAGSNPRMLKVADYLIDRVRAAGADDGG
ncbi:thiol:disulfide interchange protein DsbA/DsbL [Salinisphaera sp.]|uniref:thiol:disulfide interchange protein DsbA/DsbL n=1 Tax=Salinisphaera sp. TaxID=1914330 RepID=UPI002D768B7E|nr:thiol:disulfide interchange protein DsbA/DsbL [Salinisphaera sp.]HET7313599.1 thiol:disulfide interchange protein DsbA/DsbL [Salinisphaera sp.]